MKTVKEIFQDELYVKKSHFIAFLGPFCSFDSFLLHTKAKHAKASHIVYAYRILQNKQILENKHDAKEPKGTIPCLNLLQKHDLVNTSLIIIRYFGGTKLGVGGLLRAYTEVANKTILKAELVNFEELYKKRVKIELKNLKFFESFLARNLIAYSKEFKENFVLLDLNLNQKQEVVLQEFTKLNPCFFSKDL